MGLMEKIADDMKVAMKSGEKLRLETLRTLRAGLLEMQVEKRPSGGMTPEDEMSVLISASKKRKESIDIFRANGRNELADQESLELSIIQEYLPKQMSAEEVELAVKKVIADSGASTAKDFPKVMGPVMKDLKGKADGKMIQETVKRLLGA
jgi:uncharacterized protein YqeY